MGECISPLLKGLHCRQGRAQRIPQSKAGSILLWGKALISHSTAADWLVITVTAVAWKLSDPLLKSEGSSSSLCCRYDSTLQMFFLRLLELAFSWLPGAVMERSRFKSLISPIWIDLNFPWPCLGCTVSLRH